MAVERREDGGTIRTARVCLANEERAGIRDDRVQGVIRSARTKRNEKYHR